MPRRLLLDGEDLGALMQRVRAEMGPDAVVVKAERVRTGGVAGFFAKERFEVTVEVPDRPGQPPRAPRPPGPVGMSALLEAAEAAEGDGSAPDGGATPRDPATPRLSTDGDRFARLLASIDDMADVRPPGGQPAAAGGADAGRPAGAADAGRPAEAADAADQAASDEPATSKPPAARFAPQGATVTTAAFGPLAPARSADPPAPADADAAGTQAPADAETAARAGTAAPAEPAAPGEPPAGAEPEGTRDGADRPADGPGFPRYPAASAAAVPTIPPHPGIGPSTGGSSRGALARLGVPAALLGTGPTEEPLPLSGFLAGLPRPPAPLRAPGALVAVVGEGPTAIAVATGLAQRVRLDPHEVVLAGDVPPVQGHGRRLLTPAAAARQRDKATAAESATIVAVGVGPEKEDWAAASALLRELGPDQSWAVVDARRKTADLRAWMRAVARPRPFDVVAATWVHETQEPGTVLDLGAPVGWVDGLPATPVVWAAVLGERLDAGTGWD